MKKYIKNLTLIFIISFSFLFSQQPQRVSFNLKNVPLSDLLRILGEQTGKKFVCDEELSKRIVSLRLENVTTDEAISTFLNLYNLYYVKPEGTENIYIIKDRQREPFVTITKIIPCNYVKAEEMANVLTPKLSRTGSIRADKLTNSLIVNDMADVVEIIEGLLKEIDKPTPQVLIEARVVEMVLSSGLKFGTGIQNMYNSEKFWTSPLEKKRAEVFEDYEVPKEAVQPEVNFQMLFGDKFGLGGALTTAIISAGTNIEAIIEMLATKGAAKILANPRVLVMNNQEANIDIVEEIPYQQVTLTPEGRTMITTEFKEVGIKLKVKPQINPDSSIVLTVEPQQSYRTGETVQGVPVVDKSMTQTTFLLKDGETATIGGLIREVENKTEYKLPLLGDIPILGHLFKRTIKTKDKRELTIFITATLVKQK